MGLTPSLPCLSLRLASEILNHSRRLGFWHDRQNKRQCVLDPFLVAYLQLFGMFPCNQWILISPYLEVNVMVCYAEDEVIQDFLWIDSCAKLADRVLTQLYSVHCNWNSFHFCSIFWQWCMSTSDELNCQWSLTTEWTSLSLCMAQCSIVRVW